LAHWIIRSY